MTHADAKGIYDAMYEMYEKDIFKTGEQEYDLVANGHITSEQLALISWLPSVAAVKS